MRNNVLEIALTQYGVKEIVGSEHNQTIVDYAKEAGFDWVNDDETPWCAIFMNWVAMTGDYERTKTALARDWLNVGIDIQIPSIGDVAVFSRGLNTWQAHVGLFINQENEWIHVLGGNQSNRVKISRYHEQNLLGYRRLRRM